MRKVSSITFVSVTVCCKDQGWLWAVSIVCRKWRVASYW